MKKKYKYLDKYERKIIAFLYSFGDKISTRAISKKVEIHWTTAKRSLESLKEKGVIKKFSMGNKILWKMNPLRT